MAAFVTESTVEAGKMNAIIGGLQEVVIALLLRDSQNLSVSDFPRVFCVARIADIQEIFLVMCFDFVRAVCLSVSMPCMSVFKLCCQLFYYIHRQWRGG